MPLRFDVLKSGGDIWFDNPSLQQASPSITAVDQLIDGATTVLTVTNASATGNRVLLNGEEQVITAESETEIQFTVDGQFSYLDADADIVIEDENGSQSNPFTETLLPASGWFVVDISAPFLGDASTRLSSTPDLVIGHQIGWDDADVSVENNGTANAAETVTTHNYWVFDGIQRSATAEVTWEDPPIPQTTVPDIIGLSEAAALSAATGADMDFIVIATAYHASIAEDLVCAQFPPEAAEVNEGTTLEATLSLGPQPPLMPDLVGLDIATAISQIDALDIQYIQVNVAASGGDVGNILAQSVAPGAEVPFGTTVTLLAGVEIGGAVPCSRRRRRSKRR